MSDWVDYPLSVPVVAPRQPSPREYCEKSVPWYCGAWGFPALTNVFGDNRCAEAWDLFDACISGGFPRPVAGSGAGPAPDLAARPGVNYNDPEVLRRIEEQQRAGDKVRWFETIAANRNIIEGAPKDEAEPSEGWAMALALGVIVLGMFAVQGGHR